MQFDSNASSFEQAPVGNHVAKLIRIVDLGTQESEYKGQKNSRRQSLFTWELPYETRDDGQPFIISKFYTQSVGEKANLTKDLTSWLGKAPKAPTNAEEGKKFTEEVIKPLLGKACQVIITEKEDTGKRQVSTVVGLGKGTTAPEDTHNPIVFFDLDDYDEDVFDGLSERIQQMIMSSPEYTKAISGDAVADTNDDVPF